MRRALRIVLAINTQEIAVASFVGALVLAAVDLAAIPLLTPWPAGGASVRILHHLFSFVHVVGAGIVLAHLPLWWRRLPLVPPWTGWLAMSAVSIYMAFGLYEYILGRRAAVYLFHLGLDASWIPMMYIVLVVTAGLLVPVAYVVGCACGRHWAPSSAALGLGAWLVYTGHTVLLDEYEEFHLGTLWTAGTLIGATLAPRCISRFGDLRVPRTARIAVVAVAMVGLLWPPSNRVRLDLFERSGSVVSYALARLWWALPSPTPTAPAGFEAAPKTFSGPDDPLVVVVTVDALRAEMVARASADFLPHFARLRDEGAYFTNAHSSGSQTSASLTGLMTGQYLSHYEYEWRGPGRDRHRYPVFDVPFLSQILGKAGVHTEVYYSHIRLGKGYLDVLRDFATTVMVSAGHAHSRDVVRPILESLATLERSKPTMVYTHLLDAHEPYDRGEVKVGTAYERYVSEVEVVDRELGILWRRAQELHGGRLYLVVSADHGEAFGEHNTTFHSKTLYEELIHVPLIIWGPGVPPTSIDTTVTLLDVGPTLCELFGLEPVAHWQGQSLWSLVVGQADRLERPVAAEARRRRAYFAANGLKVQENRRRKTIEVFDLASDPKEEVNLFDQPGRRDDVMSAIAEMHGYFARFGPESRPPYFR